MFKRSTRQIVLGRKKAAETARGGVSQPTMQDIGEAETEELVPEGAIQETHKMEGEQIMEKPKKKVDILEIWTYVLMGCFVMGMLYLIIVGILSAAPEKATEQTLTIPDGMGVVSCESALASQAGTGDVVQLYDANGHPIAELQYVEVLSTGDGSLLLLLDDTQTEAYIRQFGGTAVLVTQGGTKKAETLLDYQRSILDPEIALTALTDLEMAPGDTLQLEVTATATPTGGILPDIVWQSDNPAVAIVNQAGGVTAVDVGSAVITAACGDASVSCTVTVRVALEEMTMSVNTAEIAIGEVLSLAAIPNPENATDFTVQWFVDNPDVAAVDSNGMVTGAAVGTAVVTAQCGELSASCTVNVGIFAEMIQLNSHTMEMSVGGKSTLVYSLYPSEGVTQTPVYSSSDEAIVTVAQDGTVTAVSAGSVTITVTCGDVSDTCSITVYD